MAKSQPSAGAKVRYKELPVSSPIKKRRTQTTKARMIQPVALRKLAVQRNRSLNSVMESLAQPPHVHASLSKHPSKSPTEQPSKSPTQQHSKSPTQQPSTSKIPSKQPPSNLKPTIPQKQPKNKVLSEFQLRRSPRKHLPIPPNKHGSKTQNPTNKSGRTPPPAQTADLNLCTQQHDVSSDIELDTRCRPNKNRHHGLVDEELDNLGNAVDDQQQCDDDGDGDMADGGDALPSDEDNEALVDDEGDVIADDQDGQSIDEGGELNANEGHGGQNVARGLKKRRGRGPTRCLRWVGVTGDCRPRIVLNTLKQPIGPRPVDVAGLSSTIGITVKNTKVISLEYPSWRLVPQPMKEALWNIVQITFDVPEDGRAWVYSTAGESWRTHKSRLKAKYYEEGKSVAEMMKITPTEEIPPYQWEQLVKYWCDPKTVEMSRRNRLSVKKRKNVHTAGSCSFARIAAQETKDGIEPGLAKVFIKTRTRKTGDAFLTDQAKADLMNLDDDAAVEEYLLSNGLISKQPGKVPLRGRGVCKKDLKRAQREEEIKKKAEDRIDLVKAECLERIEAINLHYSTVIHNLVTKLKSCNLQPDFEDFNPFEGCPDNTYVPPRELSSDDEVSNDQFDTDQED